VDAAIEKTHVLVFFLEMHTSMLNNDVAYQNCNDPMRMVVQELFYMVCIDNIMPKMV
jgi:hypothetical protein